MADELEEQVEDSLNMVVITTEQSSNTKKSAETEDIRDCKYITNTVC